jgi:hypothetical protein
MYVCLYVCTVCIDLKKMIPEQKSKSYKYLHIQISKSIYMYGDICSYLYLKEMILEIKFCETSRESSFEPKAETNFKQFSLALMLLKFGQLLRPIKIVLTSLLSCTYIYYLRCRYHNSDLKSDQRFS